MFRAASVPVSFRPPPRRGFFALPARASTIRTSPATRASGARSCGGCRAAPSLTWGSARRRSALSTSIVPGAAGSVWPRPAVSPPAPPCLHQRGGPPTYPLGPPASFQPAPPCPSRQRYPQTRSVWPRAIFPASALLSQQWWRQGRARTRTPTAAPSDRPAPSTRGSTAPRCGSSGSTSDRSGRWRPPAPRRAGTARGWTATGGPATRDTGGSSCTPPLRGTAVRSSRRCAMTIRCTGAPFGRRARSFRGCCATA
mmetsp:Transcript_46997/g.91726  ORF Transcript_46997/g.91726 Transcript_46997/m.91726 type:complete len:255 (+) Transcript_46997:2206-2970(+)